MNFWKRYVGDYLRDTGHLSLAEHGAYTLLLDHYYSTGKSLPAPHESLYRLCRATGKAEQSAVRSVADEFFPVNGDGTRHNRRADLELGKWGRQAEHNRTIGQLGGRPRKPGNNPDGNPKRNPHDNPEGNPDPNPDETLSRNQKPETRKSKVNTEAPVAPVWLPKTAFEEFEKHRKAIRKPMTALAKSKLIAELSRLKAAGNDPTAVLEQSIRNGWTGVFPLRVDAGSPPQYDFSRLSD